MKLTNAILIGLGGLVLYNLLKKDSAGTNQDQPRSDTDENQLPIVADESAAQETIYNEYNTYNQYINEAAPGQTIVEQPPISSELPKTQPQNPVYVPPASTPASFPTQGYTQTRDVSPNLTTTSKQTSTVLPSKTTVTIPPTVKEASVATATVKSINGTTETCMVRPVLNGAVLPANKVIFKRDPDNVVRVYTKERDLYRRQEFYGLVKVSI